VPTCPSCGKRTVTILRSSCTGAAGSAVQGLDDMRRALALFCDLVGFTAASEALALEQGQGRTAALLHNNLALAAWQYEGPQAALAACREGIDFCERRGIVEYALAIASESTTFLAELGLSEQALAEALPLAERLEADGDIASVEPRSLQLRLLAERGAHEQATAADQLLATTRESGEPQDFAMALSAAVRLLLPQGQQQRASALLVELEQVVGIRADLYYAAALPALVRSSVALRQPELATRLVDGVEPRTPLIEHALSACRAQLTEVAGEHAEAAKLYAAAAERWRDFGNVPERAYALLGQAAVSPPWASRRRRGRCARRASSSRPWGSLRR